MNWQPYDLCRCVGSDWLGWATAGLAGGVCAWYGLIARRWLESAQHASGIGRSVWWWLVVIFIVCAAAGYGSWIVAVWFPRTAVVLRLAVLITQNVACPVFLYYASSQRFQTIGKYEGMGEALTRAVTSPDHLNDRELAQLARQLVAKSLERQGSVSCG